MLYCQTCPYCHLCKRFQVHDCRARTFRLIVDGYVKIFRSGIWLALPRMREAIHRLPSFGLPYKRFVTEVLCDRCRAFSGSDQSYREVVQRQGREFVYDDRQDETLARQGAALTHSTVWRWLSWLDVSYHQRPHSETKQPPRQRYEQGRSFTRHVDLQQTAQYFFRRERRKVSPVFSDVRLKGCFFRVDPQLRGDWVQVRYDPFTELETVLLYSDEGEYLGVGQRYQRERPALQPPPAKPPGPPRPGDT